MSAKVVSHLQLGAAHAFADGADLRRRLLDALGEHAAVEIDTGALREADVPLIQILIAAHRTARRRGRSFRVRAPAGGALERALTRAGFIGPGGRTEANIPWLCGEAA